MYAYIHIRFDQSLKTVGIFQIFELNLQPFDQANYANNKKYLYRICKNPKNCVVKHKHLRRCYVLNIGSSEAEVKEVGNNGKRLKLKNTQFESTSSEFAEDLHSSDTEIDLSSDSENNTDSSSDNENNKKTNDDFNQNHLEQITTADTVEISNTELNIVNDPKSKTAANKTKQRVSKIANIIFFIK